jgi:hypothetical protein
LVILGKFYRTAAYVLLNNEESLLDAVVYHCQQAKNAKTPKGNLL